MGNFLLPKRKQESNGSHSSFHQKGWMRVSPAGGLVKVISSVYPMSLTCSRSYLQDMTYCIPCTQLDLSTPGFASTISLGLVDQHNGQC